jgi:predicted Rossmann-fold nucleotide-binding protein
MAEFIEGFEFLSKLKGEVTIFGSARALPGNPYYKVAKELGYMLGKKWVYRRHGWRTGNDGGWKLGCI